MDPKYKIGDRIGFFNGYDEWLEVIIEDIKYAMNDYVYMIAKHSNPKKASQIGKYIRTDATITDMDAQFICNIYSYNQIWRGLNV